MLQALDHPHGPSLDLLQYVHLSLVQGSPALDEAPQIHLTRAEQSRRITSLNLLATLLLIQLSPWKLPGHIDDSCPVFGPSSPALQNCFPDGQPQPALVRGVVFPKGQDLTFAFGELHKVPFNPFLQPLQVPLNGRHAMHFVNHSAHTRKSAIARPDPEKKIKQTKPDHASPTLVHHLKRHSCRKSLCVKGIHTEIIMCT